MSGNDLERYNALQDECTALRAERDALKDWLFGCKKERDALKAQMETVAKGSFDATAVMAEENRLLREELVDYRTCNQSANGHIGELSNQLGQARAECAKLVEKWREEADNTPSRVNDFKVITLCYCAEQLESALNGTPPKP